MVDNFLDESGSPTLSKPEQVGPRLTATRVYLGMKKLHFAKAIGLDPSTLTKVEAGKVRLDLYVAEKIWKLYDFSMDWIYLGIEDALGRKRAEVVEIYRNVLRERQSKS